MNRWLFGCDESGTFEPGERVAFLVGGVLLPDCGAAQHLGPVLKKLCNQAGMAYPPHATELRQAGERGRADALLAATTKWLKEQGGWFIGLICKPRSQVADPALHARMLGALVELCGRVAAAHGAESLTLHPASRGFALDEGEVEAYRRAGLQVLKLDGDWQLKGVVGSEVREALDALRRAPAGLLPAFPVVDEVRVKSAKANSVHPTVLAADLFCNCIYGAVRKKKSVSLSELVVHPDWLPERALVVEYNHLAQPRGVDEALRRDPPNLWTMAEAWEQLLVQQQQVTPHGDLLPLGLEGADQVCRLFWQAAESKLLDTCAANPRLLWAITQRLAGDSRAELDMKHGAYEGTARALSLGFAGDNAFARLARGVSDSELCARLHCAIIECCNHRGDTVGGREAYERFIELFRQGGSLSLLVEALTVENLANVLEQNELPTSIEQTAQHQARLAKRARSLLALTEAISERLGELVSGADIPPEAVEDEVRLRELIGDAGPLWSRPDRQHGRAYGTVARSFAFCGQLDKALETALTARRYFVGSPFDLKMNAAVMARIRLEQARLRMLEPSDALLRVLLELAGTSTLTDPIAVLEAFRADAGSRFGFDLLLRQLLWDVPVSEQHAHASLLDALGGREASPLFRLLRDQRSHPTELIARHAAELLRVHRRREKDIAAWFELSLALTENAPGTLGRFALFTRVLKDGGSADGPSGSVLNPCFEYR